MDLMRSQSDRINVKRSVICDLVWEILSIEHAQLGFEKVTNRFDAKRSAVKYEGVWENPLTEHAQFCASNFKFVKSNCPELVKFSWEVWINRAPHTEKLSFVGRNSV